MQDQFHSITSSTAASVLSVIEDDMTRPQPILLRTSTLKVFFLFDFEGFFSLFIATIFLTKEMIYVRNPIDIRSTNVSAA